MSGVNPDLQKNLHRFVTFPHQPDRRPDLAFAAAIFDMDGVITETATVHASAWKRMFDDYLRQRERERGEPFREFSPADYRAHVDGRPRYQGVEAFLASRGIRLPPGAPADPAGAETVCGLGNRKNEFFNGIIQTEGVKVYGSTLALIHALRAAGILVGLATSSRNSTLVLSRTPITCNLLGDKLPTRDLFGAIVDGLVSERLGLQGKPHPDIFVAAAATLGVPPARAIVVEDAVSGVQAGAHGGFGLVVGVAREDNARELREAGADLVVRDLADVDLPGLDALVRAKREAVR
jgi:beta-phosphoglucomutase-like phosphatase (HAD superfamily)